MLAPAAAVTYLSASCMTAVQSRFALLVAQPLEGYEAWGANVEGQSKPFRFDFEPHSAKMYIHGD
jgi:hypothetical protein